MQGGHDHEGRNVIVWGKHGGLNQQWDIKYLDRMRPEPKKGELNRDYGLYVQRPFHVVTKMKSHRYLDILGRNLVIKTPNGRPSQVFWFDQRTKTVKSHWQKGWSFHWSNNGKGKNMQMYNTNSQWW